MTNITYTVSITNPQLHLFDVELKIDKWEKKQLNLKMPVWTPGFYLVREYARHLQNFQVKGNKQNNLSYQKKTKNHWLIETDNETTINVKYQIYANELTVRTNHLDETHGFFTGAALFLYVPNFENNPFKVVINSPEKDWKITTSLPKITEENNSFFAENFDCLVDSPFEIGLQKQYDFTVENKPHQWIIWGNGNIDAKRVIEDTKKIIETESKIFSGLPYEDYKFILHLSASGFGGLEHKNCCVLNYPRFAFKKEEKYYRFMQLVAHEFFHLWNVKRIRPKALEKFDYDQENYTTSLWFSEGTTSYYDILIPLRAGIYNRSTFLDLLSKDISNYLNISGRKIQPLAESSFDAWIKLYRRDAYSNNNQISYYLKGELVTLLLDLMIRKNSGNQKSFDDVMAIMWDKFGKKEIGFTPEELKTEIEKVANTNLKEFFHLYLETTEEIPFNQYFEPFGLVLRGKKEDNDCPYLGLTVQKEGCIEKITFVEANSPAGKAGVDAGDELLAIDGFRVTSETLSERLQDYRAGDAIALTIFHQEELKTVKIKLAPPQASSYQVTVMKNLTKAQKENLHSWLGR